MTFDAEQVCIVMCSLVTGFCSFESLIMSLQVHNNSSKSIVGCFTLCTGCLNGKASTSH